MAAVFALVFLPALAAVALMLHSATSLDLSTVLALGCFVAMASGVFYGTLRLAYRWEHEPLE